MSCKSSFVVFSNIKQRLIVYQGGRRCTSHQGRCGEVIVIQYYHGNEMTYKLNFGCLIDPLNETLAADVRFGYEIRLFARRTVPLAPPCRFVQIYFITATYFLVGVAPSISFRISPTSKKLMYPSTTPSDLLLFFSYPFMDSHLHDLPTSILKLLTFL